MYSFVAVAQESFYSVWPSHGILLGAKNHMPLYPSRFSSLELQIDGVCERPSVMPKGLIPAKRTPLEPFVAHEVHPPSYLNALASELPIQQSGLVLDTLQRSDFHSNRYETARRVEDLVIASRGYRSLLALAPPEGGLSRHCQSSLCLVLRKLHEHTGDEESLAQSISFGKNAVSETVPSDTQYGRTRLNLANALISRYLRTSILRDLDDASDLLEAALHNTSSRDDIHIRTTLAHCLRTRSTPTNDLGALQRALALLEPLRDYNDPSAICELALCFHHRYERFKKPEDIEEAIDLCNRGLEAASVSTASASSLLHILSICLRMRYQDLGSIEDLEKAVDFAGEALERMPQRSVLRPKLQVTFAYATYCRYTVQGQPGDLEKAIADLEAIERLQTPTSVCRACCLEALTLAYVDRFDAYGRTSDLDLAVSFARRCVEATLLSKVDYAIALFLLSKTLWTRFYHFRHAADLSEYGECAEAAFQHMPDSHQTLQCICISNLGTASRRLYDQRGDPRHLDNAIRHLQEALRLRGGEPRYYKLYEEYYDLGEALLSRAELHKNPADWRDGISAHRKGLAHSRPGLVQRRRALRAIGNAHRRWFSAGGQGDLQIAIELHQEALSLAAPGLPDRALSFCDYAATLHALYRSNGDELVQERAIECYMLAAEDASSFLKDRYHAAQRVGHLAYEKGKTALALAGYEIAVKLLPRIAWIGLDKQTRLDELKKQALDVAVDSAAAAIELGRYEEAAELLEQSRGVFWTQILALRADVDELDRVEPRLANELRSVSRVLEMDQQGTSGLDQEHQLQRRRRSAARWEALVHEIRATKGFDKFLRPLQFFELRKAASRSPIVIVNASHHRCDMLIVTLAHGVQHVRLPLMTVEMARGLHATLTAALKQPRDRAGRIYLERTVIQILDLLWTAFGEPLCAALSALYPAALPRRVHLCPVGVASLLPLHAALPRRMGGRGLPDLMVCSYTKSLTALLDARQRETQVSSGCPRLLAVSLPSINGQEGLPRAVNEMQVIRNSRIGSRATFIEGPSATVARVCEELETHNWLHIATHGSSNSQWPLDSCLRMHDGPLTLSRISQLHLPHAEFAFLSACHAARNCEQMPDESMHLTAGLQVAGVSGAIATMWSIADKDAPEVARIVYAHLTRDGRTPTHHDAAEGWHKAITALRRRNVPASRWAAFVHIGV